jgi:hypothetical protein
MRKEMHPVRGHAQLQHSSLKMRPDGKNRVDFGKHATYGFLAPTRAGQD